MMENASLIREQLRTFRFIHFAMVMGSVTYGLVVILIDKYAPMPPTMTDMQLLNTIKYASIPYIVSVMIIAKTLRTKMLTSDSIFTQKTQQQTDEKSDRPPFLANYLTSLFIIWAIIETITIGGIVLFLISGELIFPLILISTGVFFKIVNGPRLEELNQLSTKYNFNLTQGL